MIAPPTLKDAVRLALKLDAAQRRIGALGAENKRLRKAFTYSAKQPHLAGHLGSWTDCLWPTCVRDRIALEASE